MYSKRRDAACIGHEGDERNAVGRDRPDCDRRTDGLHHHPALDVGHRHRPDSRRQPELLERRADLSLAIGETVI